MDTSRLTPADIIAGVGGVVLLISLWLAWYGVSVEIAGSSASASASGWEALSWIDIILFLCALVAIGVVVGRMADALPPDVPVGVVLLAVGGLAVLLVLFRIIDIPASGDIPDEVDLSRKVGVFIALIASGAIAYAGWRANEERPGGPSTSAAAPPPPAA